MVLQFHLICFLSCHFLVSYSYQFTARCNTKIVNREHLSLHSTAESSVEDNQASFFFSKKAFGAIGMKDSMTGVINSLNLDRPSKIQALSYNEILSAKTCIVADQTGSGKTLAYLLPIIQRMTEMKKNGTLGTTKPKSPYILIIAPTTELASQVSRVVKTISNVLKFRTACLTSVSDADSEQRKLRLGTEVLIATPGRLISALNRGEVSLGDVQSAVLDEADVLFMDQSFDLEPIGSSCPQETQFIFATATLPNIVVQQILQEFPECALLRGPGLHRVSPIVEETLIDCSGPASQEKNSETAFENKRLALLRALEQTPTERTVIFCNTIAQCRKVENALQRVDRQSRLRVVYPYHGAIDAKTRSEHMTEFSRPLLKVPSVLVCTDRASRGMDFDKAQVDHVVLFDFPQEPSEYVRRVGRTGRAGRRGTVTVLVHGRQVPIAKQVLGASIEGKKIEPVPELSNLESWRRSGDNE